MFRHGIILLFSLLAGCTPAEMPVLNLPSYPRSDTGDPCALKDSCVVVFVTPWCPNCHEAIPFINDLSRHFAKSNVTGFRIVIGSDENERLEEMARQFEGAVFLDREGTFKSAMRFNAVPSWWVTNKERKVLKSFSGGGMLSDGSEYAPNEIKFGFSRILFWGMSCVSMTSIIYTERRRWWSLRDGYCCRQQRRLTGAGHVQADALAPPQVDPATYILFCVRGIFVTGRANARLYTERSDCRNETPKLIVRSVYWSQSSSAVVFKIKT